MWIERTDRTLFARWWWTVDRVTLACLALLTGIGMLVIASASLPEAVSKGLEPYYYFKRHFVFALMGCAIVILLSLQQRAHVARTAIWLFAIAFALVCITVIAGAERNGAQRWLSVAGLSLQPVEILKPAFVVLMAWVFAQRFSRPTARILQVSLLLLAVTLTPLLLQPDVGQSFLLAAIWGLMLFLAGYSLWLFGGMLCAGIGAIGLAYLQFPHVATRFQDYFTRDFDKYSQSGIAIRAFQNGGAFGRGANEGQLTPSLPDSYADYIFAAVGEEFGFFVGAILVGLICLIVLRGLARLLHEEEPFPFLATAGLLALFGLQSLMNMAVNLGLMPPKGITLPFVSYGGSSLLGMAIVMGFILALTRRTTAPRRLSVYRHRRLA